MPDVNTGVEASATPTPQQFDSWDNEGNPVVSKKPEAPAPKTEEPAASAAPAKKGESEPKGKSAAESETAPNKQERKPGEKLSAAEELGKLRRELREARAEAETLRERSRATGPKPGETTSEAKPAQPSGPDKEPTPDDKNSDGTPRFKSYEEYVKAQARWEVRQEIAASQAEQARNESSRKFADAVSQARQAYQDFDTVAEPMAAKVNELILDPKVDGTLKKVLFDSDGAHILYALGSDPKLAESFASLARTDPAEAIYMWKSLKAAVKKELSGTSEATPKAAESKEPAPAAPKPRAPKPPSEVGGRGASGEDALVSAAKSNDFRAFEAEQTRRALASRR